MSASEAKLLADAIETLALVERQRDEARGMVELQATYIAAGKARVADLESALEKMAGLVGLREQQRDEAVAAFNRAGLGETIEGVKRAAFAAGWEAGWWECREGAQVASGPSPTGLAAAFAAYLKERDPQP